MILQEVKKNKTQSFFIISLFILVITIGLYFVCLYFELGVISIVIAVIVSSISAISVYYNSDKIILSLSNAKPATKEENLQLTNILEGLCIASGLPKPKLYVIQDKAPNAFATGRNPENAVICITTGLLEQLDKYELEGVIAHELSHIKNYDILLSTIITVFVGLVVIISDFLTRFLFFGGKSRSKNSKGGSAVALIAIIFIILSPIFATLMQLAISRKREYLADSSAVEITRNKEGLISALKKLSNYNGSVKSASRSTAHLYIVKPIKNKKNTSLFNTHPPIEERIKRLENIS